MAGMMDTSMLRHDTPIAPPRIGLALSGGISGARSVEYPGVSHGVPIQCADQVNALLLEHF